MNLAGVLLTGGKSSRMGADKTRLRVGGALLIDQLSEQLAHVAAPVLHVGRPHPRYASVIEYPHHSGPLSAIATARHELLRVECDLPALVLACDLPLLDEYWLTTLAEWPGNGSVVPRVEGSEQWLCARWSRRDLDRTVDLAHRGERSVRAVFARPDPREPRQFWDIDPTASWRLRDVDTPADVACAQRESGVEISF